MKDDTVSRRRFLRGSAFLAGGIGALAISASRAEAKVPKVAAGYQDKPNGSERCDNCQFFVPPHSCRAVAGVISPHGWCELWMGRPITERRPFDREVEPFRVRRGMS